MPQPLTYSVDVSIPGTSRTVIFRRANDWMTDTAENIIIQAADFEHGSITGWYSFSVTVVHTYIITSTITVDVYDSQAGITLTDTVLQRSAGAVSESIFLQSIADLAGKDAESFINNMRLAILSP